MTGQSGRRGPVASQPATTSIAASTSLPAIDVTAYSYVAPPCGRRNQATVMVLRCPVCAAGHTHRTHDLVAVLNGETWRTCPVTGERYRLAPVWPLSHPARPIVAVPQQRRPEATVGGAA
jgi:hypothetical protein